PLRAVAARSSRAVPPPPAPPHPAPPPRPPPRRPPPPRHPRCRIPPVPLRAESSSSAPRIDLAGEAPARHREARSEGGAAVERHPPLARAASRVEIGRASCRERVESSVAAVAVRKKMETEKTDARRETR